MLSPYTFEEFCEHFRAMPTVMRYTHVRPNYRAKRPPLEVGDDHDHEANTMRMMDYFAQQGGEPDYLKQAALSQMLYWFAEHARSFLDAGTGLRTVGTDGAMEVPPSLLRAVFDAFEANKWERPADVAPIVERARDLFAERDA